MVNNIKYGLLLLTGLLLSGYMFYSINDKYALRNKVNLESAKLKVALKLAREIDRISLALETIGVFMENTDAVGEEIFDELSNPFLDELFGLQSIIWIEALRGTNLPDNGDAPEGIVSLENGNYKETFVVSLANSISPLEKDSQLTVPALEQLKPELSRTLTSRRIAYSDNPVLMGQRRDAHRYFTILQAVYDTLAARPMGVILSEYRLNDFVENTLRFEIPMLYLQIATDTLIEPRYTSFSRAPEITREVPPELHELKVGDKSWYVKVWPREMYHIYPHAAESYFVLFLGIATSLLLVMTLRQRDLYSTRLKKEVRERTLELEESNKLKENLLREIHHRVKNNLQIASSLMNMQKRKVKGEEARAALEDSQNRILAIALTHQKIYQDKDTKAVNLKEYLVDLTSYQKKLFPSIHYVITSPEILIDLDKAVPIALIISELLINATKHAFPDRDDSGQLEIRVLCTKEEDVTITVKDNGIGFGPDFDLKQSNGLGFKIINSLCKQISARFTYADENGARFEISFSNRS